MIAVPDLPPDTDTLAAALAYAGAGFYVGPVDPDTKAPRLGRGWQEQTSRDGKTIAFWFSGTDHGVFLHAGRSGVVVFDVDDPSQLPPELAKAIEEHGPPYQSTRPDQPGRGHYLFAVPDGRVFGNGRGSLGTGWGEVRGRNGLIVAAPTRHVGGGRYEWRRSGPVPVLPPYLADRLPDAETAVQAAPEAAVAAFLGDHDAASRPELLELSVAGWRRKVAAGESRHDTTTGHLAGAMKEARAGLVSAQTAADTFESLFLDAVTREGEGLRQGTSRSLGQAQEEWRGLLGWAVGQAMAADPEAVLARAKELLPDLTGSTLAAPAVPAAEPVSVDAATGEVVEQAVATRRITLTAASTITPQRVAWLWDGRLPLGTLGLLAGREGLGKSTLGYWLAAQVTRGLLPGELHGDAKAVLVCATEDSWEHTIVPRLIAAEANLDKVFRVEMVTVDDLHFGLSLPQDLVQVERSARDVDAALLLLDPLMSRLSDKLDTHRDGDVRRALEPLVAVASRANLAVLGLIHHNKSGSTDPLQLVMASKAFTAVARSVHTVVPDPDDDTRRRRLFGTPKNNLGPDDLPTLSFTIESHPIETDDGTAWTGRIEWGEELTEGITETMRRAGEPDNVRTAVSEAADWLGDYLTANGGVVPSADAKRAGRAAGHSDHALQQARQKLRLWVKSEGFPRLTYWGDPQLANPEVPR